MKPKYLLIPGYGRAMAGGQYHYLNYLDLVAFYKLNDKECLYYDARVAHEAPGTYQGLIVLTPRHDGNYQL